MWFGTDDGLNSCDGYAFSEHQPKMTLMVAWHVGAVVCKRRLAVDWTAFITSENI